MTLQFDLEAKKVTTLGLDVGVSSVGFALLEYPLLNENEYAEAQALGMQLEGRVIKTGVVWFDAAEEPKTGASLAVKRRTRRGMRRLTNRRKQRLNALERLLTQELGITEAVMKDIRNPEKAPPKSPWELRAEGLERKLEAEELARVLYHMARHRGFQSNRKGDNSDEDGKVLQATKLLKEKLQDKTFGQMMSERLNLGDSVVLKPEELYKRRLRNKQNDKGEGTYHNTPMRDWLRDEAARLLATQETFGWHACGEQFQEKFKKCAFDQRPLKSVANMIGNCALIEGEKRACKHTYTAERFIAWQKINHLRIQGRKPEWLLPEERQAVWQKLHETKEVTYKQLRELLALEENQSFKGLLYSNPEKKPIQKLSNKATPEDVNKAWEACKAKIEKLAFRSLETGDVRVLQMELTPETWSELEVNFRTFKKMEYWALRKTLEIPITYQAGEYSERKGFSRLPDTTEDKAFFKLTVYPVLKQYMPTVPTWVPYNPEDASIRHAWDEVATALSLETDEKKLKALLTCHGVKAEKQDQLMTDTAKFTGTIGVSLKACYTLEPQWVSVYDDDAAQPVDYYEASKRTGLGIRKKGNGGLLPPFDEAMTNPVVKRSLSQVRKVVNTIVRRYGVPHFTNIEFAREMSKTFDERKKLQRDNTEREEERLGQNQEIQKTFGQEAWLVDGLKYRLWKEQGGFCMYSGEYISNSQLQDPLYTQIDHILPYSQSWDNSFNNKVLVLSSENQRKSNRCAYTYIATEKSGAELERYKVRVQSLGNSTKKANLLRTEVPEDMKARHLHNTAYVARLVRQHCDDYLYDEGMYKNNKPNMPVYPELPNGMTAKRRVRCTSGSITTYLRKIWGLNHKSREESLRHHAEDACIIAATTEALVQRLTDAEKDYQYALKKKLVDLQKNKLTMDESWFSKEKAHQIKLLKENHQRYHQPWLTFRNDVIEACKTRGENCPEGTLFVYRKPIKKMRGEIHRETIYTEAEALKQKWLCPTTKRVQKANVIPHKIHYGYSTKGDIVRCDIFKKQNKRGKWEFYMSPVYAWDALVGHTPNYVLVQGEPYQLPIDNTYDFCFSLQTNDYVKLYGAEKKIIAEGYYRGLSVAVAQLNLVAHDYPTLTGGVKNYGIKTLFDIQKFVVTPLGELHRVVKETRQDVVANRNGHSSQPCKPQ
jgi:CRISPR-associated endonuclease Csn1